MTQGVSLRIGPLSKQHDRDSFDCGEPDLNEYLVDALHERARAFYLHHQFRPTPGDPLRLYIPVKQIRSWGLDGDAG